jgi:hypothetical protein
MKSRKSLPYRDQFGGCQMFPLRRWGWVLLSGMLGFGVTLVARTVESPELARSLARTAGPGVVVRFLWTSRTTGSERWAWGQAATQAGSEVVAEIERQVAGANGCLTCHRPDSLSMHQLEKQITCVECHGGNAKEPWNPDNPRERIPTSLGPADAKVQARMARAHVQPRRRDIWTSSANPERAGVASLSESEEFIRFVNPGDLRVAEKTCGRCHNAETAFVRKSMMTHGGMLWAAALYNNGSYPFKNPQFGEFYDSDGSPVRAEAYPAVTPQQTRQEGLLPFLQPLFRWELSQPGNVLRVFERGGRRPIEVGIPDPDEEPGRPRNRLSNRGLGTLNRTDPVFIGLQKTRLFDPTLNMVGTNDHAGDYRASGCTACHVIYANDRSKVHSAAYAAAGNQGVSETIDPMIPKGRSGHPLKHQFTRAIPTSQCMVCHMHPGTNMVSPYQGLIWWDNETDGDKMYPPETVSRSRTERAAIEADNPEGSALRGLWSDRTFLQRTGTPEFNNTLRQTRFADSHGHGWLFRAVFKRDRQGRLLDSAGQVIENPTPQQLSEAVDYSDTRSFSQRPATDAERQKELLNRAGLPVHLKDIHLERGMHCIDCHFKQDVHGDGNLYGEPRNAVEIACVDCHGTVTTYGTLVTSGPGARILPGKPQGPEERGRNLLEGVEVGRTPFGTERFSRSGNTIYQRSMVTAGLEWEIPQIKDTVTPGSPRFNPRAYNAKMVLKHDPTRAEIARASDAQKEAPGLAHTDAKMTCQSCHSSWITSCFGCHLSQTANQKKPMLHNEGTETRNWTSYNFQVLRDDVYMLGKDGSVAGGRISPVRSSSAVVVSSQDISRQRIYSQQQTVSAEGFAGQAFNTHVPHTVRAAETKSCTDCHLSDRGDNNAVMSQLLLLGTNFVNFMGRFVFVATGSGGLDAVAVTEIDEPQAVIGSDLHRLAYPKEYAAHEARRAELTTAVHHGSQNARQVQVRGEYAYIADGVGGFKVFDIAELNQKGFSEKIVTAPVSPIGQNTNVGTREAMAVAAPTTLAVDPARQRLAVNEEQSIHPLYGYIYIADRQEGLVLSTAGTLLDGNPSNNFLKRALAFNPGGQLTGAVNLTIAGNYAYMLVDRGLVVVDISTPLRPKIAATVAAPQIRQPKAIMIQFRYAFLTDADGLKVVDVTFPERPRLLEKATVPIANAEGLYVARTYAYVAAGSRGLVIVDVEHPETPRIDQTFDAAGQLNDTRDVKIAMTNASVFGYVADGKNGLRVLQMVSANGTPGAFGFSPRQSPKWIATYHTRQPALFISKGLDRDRAVDESGNQLAVFGRRGGRPLNLTEMQAMFLRPDGKGGQAVWTVSNQVPAIPPASSPGSAVVPVPRRPQPPMQVSHPVRQQD